jgi:hypothetical protein
MRDPGHSLKPNQTTKTIRSDRETRTLQNLGTVLPGASWNGIAETSTKEAAN